MRQVGLQDELASLYFELLKQKVKDQYRGHEDYHLMLDSINSRIPIVGGKIQIQKEDQKGNFRTVSYNVTVKDDLGNFIKSIDDLGGQCIKGEIAKKGHIYICLECGELFCRRHVKFVDNNFQKPLCCYGFLGWSGCYAAAWKRHSVRSVGRNYENAVTHDLIEIHKRKKLISGITKLDQEIDETVSGKPHQNTISTSMQANLPPPIKKTSRFDRFIGGSVHSFKCGNPACGKDIYLSNIICPNCRNVINVDIDSPLSCPLCNTPIRQVECEKCGGTNTL